jgi:hypothetical protein
MKKLRDSFQVRTTTERRLKDNETYYNAYLQKDFKLIKHCKLSNVFKNTNKA